MKDRAVLVGHDDHVVHSLEKGAEIGLALLEGAALLPQLKLCLGPARQFLLQTVGSLVQGPGLVLDNVLEIALIVHEKALGDLQVRDVQDGKKGLIPGFLTGPDDIGLDLDGSLRSVPAHQDTAEGPQGPGGDDVVVVLKKTFTE